MLNLPGVPTAVLADVKTVHDASQMEHPQWKLFVPGMCKPPASLRKACSTVPPCLSVCAECGSICSHDTTPVPSPSSVPPLHVRPTQYIQKDEPLGWDVAAMTDVHPEYQDSCGLCYELACDSTWTSDGYGASLHVAMSAGCCLYNLHRVYACLCLLATQASGWTEPQAALTPAPAWYVTSHTFQR